VWRAAISAIGLAFALSGCSTDVEPLARDDYAREVNALCATAISRSDGLIADAFSELYGDNPPSAPSATELQALYAGILPAANDSRDVTRTMLDEVRALAAPDEIAQDATDLWQAVEKRLDLSLGRIEEAASDPAKAIELDADDKFPFAPENARAAILGFRECQFK
jgi:hypothetical protein